MRNLLALIGLLVVGFGGIGWYMGWYTLSVAKGPQGTVEIKTSVDAQKVTEDSGKFLQQAAAVVGDQVSKSSQDAKAGPQPAPTSGSLTPVPPQTPGTTAGGWLFNLIPAPAHGQK